MINLRIRMLRGRLAALNAEIVSAPHRGELVTALKIKRRTMLQELRWLEARLKAQHPDKERQHR